jgi:hypothetical protein
MGFPDAGQWKLERNPKTGNYRVLPTEEWLSPSILSGFWPNDH